MKIQRKFQIIALSLLIAVSMTCILISRNISTNIIKQQITNNLTNTTQSRAKHIETLLGEYKVLTKTLATEITFREALNENIIRAQRIDEVNQRIKTIIETHEEISRISILDKEGIIIASSREGTGIDQSTYEIFLKGREGVFIGDLHLSLFTNKYVLSISASILLNNQFAGVLVINFDADKELFKITTDHTGLGESGEVYLVNKDGYMITPSRFIDDVILKQKVDLKRIEVPSPAESPDTSPKEEVDIIKDYRGIEVLAAHANIPEMGWQLIAEIDTQEAFAPVTQLTNTLILILALILFISIFVSSFTSSTITRPLRKLHQGTEEITKGNLNYKVGTSSPDEVGQLSRAFDEMTANLKKSREELEKYSRNLEKKVEERTQDLEIDISKRKETEENLRIEKEFTDTLIDTAQAIVLVLDKEGRIIRFNHFMEEVSGYKLEEVEGKSWFDTFLPERDRAQTKKLFLRAIDNIQTKGNINPIVTKDDHELEIEWYDKTLKDEKGKPIGLLAVGLDISERQELQKALRESQERLSFALEATNDGIWDRDLKLDNLYLNDNYYKILGFNPGEITITQKVFEEFLHPKDKKRVLQKIQECTEGKIKDYSVEFRIKTKSGKWKWILGRGKVVSHDSTGKALRFLGTHVDISERKQMEETLRNSKEEFANLFQNNPEAAVYTDENGDILNINSRFIKLFGYTLDEIKGKNINSGIIHSPDKLEEARELDKRAASGGYFGFETMRKKKDGTLFPVYITGSSMYIDGKKKGIIGLYRDITERIKMEKELEKLARVDSLTGCYSRGYGLELLDRQIKLSHRSKSPLLLAFLDIDGFKFINDNFGHDEGDQVLKQTVNLFKSTLREVDIICRMGGDEFLLIFPDNSLKDVSLIRNRLQNNLSKLNKSIKKNYQIKFSMGFSEYQTDKPKALDELINIADQRMYEEKKINNKIQKEKMGK